MLAISLRKYEHITDGEQPTRVYRTIKEIYGKNKVVVIKFSQKYYEAEYKTVMHQIRATKIGLQKLSSRLQGYITTNRLPQNVTLKSVENNIQAILKNRSCLKKIFKIEVKKEQDKYPVLKWSASKKDITKYCSTYLGKTIYFSNVLEFSSEEIIDTYAYQWQIEKMFKISKNRRGGCWWPKFHWTDQKIRVHAFYCFLSLLLLSVLEYKARRLGIAKDVHAIVEELHDIQEIKDTYVNSNGKSFTLTRHTDQSKLQSILFKYFDFGDHFTAKM